MCIQKNGYVGIGRPPTNPQFPLDIQMAQGMGGSQTLDTITAGGTYYGQWGWEKGNEYGTDWFRFKKDKSTNVNVSFKSAHGFWSQGFFGIVVSSDERIKTNIQDVPDNLALQQLRSIPCRYYEYKDKIKRGSDKTIGFMAQEVKEIIPMAVSQQNEFIPDVYNGINCSWTLDNSDLSNVKFIMRSNDLSDVSGIKYKFYVSNNVNPSKPFDLSTNYIDSSGEKMIEIVGNSDNTFTFDNEYNNVFCYGKEVSDFNILAKEKLFTLNFSATQEIDRIQQTHVTKMDKLESKISTLETDQSNLKSIIDKLTSATSFEDFKSKL
jgi:hypothetical protein